MTSHVRHRNRPALEAYFLIAPGLILVCNRPHGPWNYRSRTRRGDDSVLGHRDHVRADRRRLGDEPRETRPPLTGSVTLTLRAYDRAGQVASASTVARVDNALPAVRIHLFAGQGYVDATATDSAALPGWN